MSTVQYPFSLRERRGGIQRSSFLLVIALVESKSPQKNFTAFFPERRGAHTADPLGSCAQLRLIFFLLEQLIVQMKGQACAFPMFINHNNEPLLFFPPVHYIAIKRYRSAVSLGKHLQKRCSGGERYVYICSYIRLRRTQWPKRKQIRDVRSEGFRSPAVPPHRPPKGIPFPGALPVSFSLEPSPYPFPWSAPGAPPAGAG